MTLKMKQKPPVFRLTFLYAYPNLTHLSITGCTWTWDAPKPTTTSASLVGAIGAPNGQQTGDYLFSIKCCGQWYSWVWTCLLICKSPGTVCSSEIPHCTLQIFRKHTTSEIKVTNKNRRTIQQLPVGLLQAKRPEGQGCLQEAWLGCSHSCGRITWWPKTVTQAVFCKAFSLYHGEISICLPFFTPECHSCPWKRQRWRVQVTPCESWRMLPRVKADSEKGLRWDSIAEHFPAGPWPCPSPALKNKSNVQVSKMTSSPQVGERLVR